MSWDEKIRRLLDGREELGPERLRHAFDAEAHPEALVECLTVFEEEYEVRMGLLRPEDPLEPFIEPPATGNPLTWIFSRFAYADRTSELEFRLAERRKRIGAPKRVARVLRTVGEYVRAWAGEAL